MLPKVEHLSNTGYITVQPSFHRFLKVSKIWANRWNPALVPPTSDMEHIRLEQKLPIRAVYNQGSRQVSNDKLEPIYTLDQDFSLLDC